MGYCYYGNYAQFFEVGRVEALRELGFSYRILEESGVMLPVRHYSVNYLRPAMYDDLLTIETTVKEIQGTRIVFDYTIYKDDEVKVATATTTLVFVSKSTMRPIAPPADFLKVLGE
jgi:acyl-CoA thioester hydrolase